MFQRSSKPVSQKQSIPASTEHHTATSQPVIKQASEILSLQHLIGNHALQRLAKPPVISGAPAQLQRALKKGSRVRHVDFGTGTVLDVSGTICEIEWDDKTPEATSFTLFTTDDSELTEIPGGTSALQEKGKEKEKPGEHKGVMDSPKEALKTHDKYGNNLNKTEFETLLAVLVNTDPIVKEVAARVSHHLAGILSTVITDLTDQQIENAEKTKKGDEESERMAKSFLSPQRVASESIGDSMGGYLYSKGGTFGSIGTQSPKSTSHGILSNFHDVMHALEGGYGNLQSMLLSHQAVLFKILMEINESFYGRLLDEIKPPEKARGRKKDPRAQQTRGKYATLGITQDKEKGKKIAEEYGIPNVLEHTRTQDSTLPDEEHEVVKIMRFLDMPFVGGLSGSTADLLVVAHHVAGLTGEDLQYYTLAIIGYLVGGGMHSVHEIMTVAANAGLGIPYTPGDYNSIFPPSFLRSPAYLLLLDEFPTLLNPVGKKDVNINMNPRQRRIKKEKKGDGEKGV